MNPVKETLGHLKRAADELEHCCARLDKLIEMAELQQTRLERIDGRFNRLEMWIIQQARVSSGIEE